MPLALVLLPWMGAIVVLTIPARVAESARFVRPALVATAAAWGVIAWSWWRLTAGGAPVTTTVAGLAAVDLLLEVDRLGLAFCGVASAVTLAALLVGVPAADVTRSRVMAAGLLAMLGAAHLLFVAADFVTFQIGWGLTALLSVALVAAGSRGRSTAAALRMLAYLSVSSVAMLLATSRLAIGPQAATGTWSFAFEDVAMAGLPVTAAQWVAAAIVAASVVRLPLIPLHGWLSPVLVSAEPAAAMTAAAILTKTGLFALLRLEGIVSPDVSAAMMQPLFWMAVVSAVFAAFAALLQIEMRRLTAWLTMGTSATAILLVSANSAGPTAGADAVVAAVAMHAGALAILLAVAGVFEVRRTAMHEREIRGAASTMPRWGVALLAAATTIVIAQLLAGLPVLAAIVEGIAVPGLPGRQWLLVLLVVTLALWALSLARPVATVYGYRPSDANRGLRDVAGRELVAIFLLGGAIAIGALVIL